MRPKSLALLLLALGCGLVASIGITEVIARRNAEPPAPTGEMQSIFVAMTDIGLGDSLTSQVLKLEEWPKDKVPSGAISRIEDVEGRRARTKLYAGEPILENRLLGKGASEQGATALIPKGYRVVPVKVDLVSGGSSLILPGDRVDVMVHLVRDLNRDIQETVTRTILQDIKVFAVNDVVDLEKEKDGGKSITAKTISLLVTPEQAAKVMLAAQLGSVNLVMRSPEDDQQTANSQAKPSELFAGGSKTDRGKETLVTEPDPSTNEKAAGFVGFLNSMKGKSAPVATPAVAATQSQQTWSMRVLKPGELPNDLVLTKTSDRTPFGEWQATTTAGGPGASQPVNNAPTTVVPPAADEPPVPAAEPLPEPQGQPDEAKKE